MSGSSFASVAKELEAIGVQQEQIVFFPSWDPDPGELLNESAQRIWRTHRKFTADAGCDASWAESFRRRMAQSAL